MKNASATIALFLGLFFAARTGWAQWHVSADFSITSNPAPEVDGGIWSYGRMDYGPRGTTDTPDTSSFALYDELGTVVDPNAPSAWQDAAAPSVDTLGAVSYNESNQFKTFFGIGWDPMEIALVMDQGRQVVSTVRFQVPASGSYAVRAEFSDNQNCCAGRESDAWVLGPSGGELFHSDKLPANEDASQQGTRNPVIYEDVLKLDANDSIYFASGKGLSGGDNVELRATVRQFGEREDECGRDVDFLRGDCNDDGTVDISDASCLLNWLFLGGDTPGCVAVTNTNGDEDTDISDATWLLNHLFLGGPTVVAPYPECGAGTLPDDEENCATPPEGCL